MHDPYDPALHRGFHWNLSEAADNECTLSQPPTVATAPVLADLELILRVTKEVKESPPYVFTG